MKTENLPLEIPFSIALTHDQFEPFTETHHRFRYYNVPRVTNIEPQEVEVGYITEVVVKIDPTSAKFSKSIVKTDANKNSGSSDYFFFEPFPSEHARFDLISDGAHDESSL